MSQRRPKPLGSSITLYAGAVVVDADPAANAVGDEIGVYGEDARIGAAALRAVPGRGLRLVATVQLAEVPLLAFPVVLRAQNERTGAEVGRGVRLADADELLRAAGPVIAAARLDGLSHRGLAFALRAERLAAYPRHMRLRTAEAEAEAISAPDAGDEHAVRFVLPAPPRAGDQLVLTDVATGAVVLDLTLTEAAMLDAAMARLARLEAESEDMRRDLAALRGAVERVTTFGTERLLLDRLDLFYLLLSDRLDRALRAGDPPPAVLGDGAARSWQYGPGDVEGVGLYDLETNGRNDWRWFGPAVTVVFRDVPAPVGRAVLAFHDFGPNGADPEITVSIGTVPVLAELSPARGDGYLLDVPVPAGARFADGAVILHLAFGHHHTSEADPRLLSAVFSGAELFAAG